jgi:hypothetical protein
VIKNRINYGWIFGIMFALLLSVDRTKYFVARRINSQQRRGGAGGGCANPIRHHRQS